MVHKNYRNKWRQCLTIWTVAAAMTLGCGMAPAAFGIPSSKQDRISQLESQIAQNRVRADRAALAVDQSAAAYAKAFDELNAAEASAKEAINKANEAAKKADAAKAELGLLALTKYRQGFNSFADFETVTETDAFHTQALKQEIDYILGAKADEQVQSLSALQNVAEVLRRGADKAVRGKKDAAKNLAETEQIARAEAEAAAKDLEHAQAQREQIIVELAKAREVSLAQERERQEKAEAARQAAAVAAAEKKRQEEAALAAQIAAQKQAQQLREAQLRAQKEAAAAKKAAEEARAAQERIEAKNQAETERIAQLAMERANKAQQRADKAQERVAEVKEKPVTAAPSKASPQGAGGALIDWAKEKVGLPYVWGGIGPDGYDCSGLIYAGMKDMGYSIERVASGQYTSLANVSYEEKQPGDLIFFSSNGTASGVYHVGIYAGDGKLLHAPRPGQNIGIVPLYNVDKIMPYVARL